MRLRSLCIIFTVIFLTTVMSHANVFTVHKCGPSAHSTLTQLTENSPISSDDGCADNSVHGGGCLHLVLHKFSDLKLNVKDSSNEKYSLAVDTVLSQEFIKKLKRPPKA